MSPHAAEPSSKHREAVGAAAEEEVVDGDNALRRRRRRSHHHHHPPSSPPSSPSDAFAEAGVESASSSSRRRPSADGRRGDRRRLGGRLEEEEEEGTGAGAETTEEKGGEGGGEEVDEATAIESLRAELYRARKSLRRHKRAQILETSRLNVRIEILTNERDTFKTYRDMYESMKAEAESMATERDELRGTVRKLVAKAEEYRKELTRIRTAAGGTTALATEEEDGNDVAIMTQRIMEDAGRMVNEQKEKKQCPDAVQQMRMFPRLFGSIGGGGENEGGRGGGGGSGSQQQQPPPRRHSMFTSTAQRWAGRSEDTLDDDCDEDDHFRRTSLPETVPKQHQPKTKRRGSGSLVDALFGATGGGEGKGEIPNKGDCREKDGGADRRPLTGKVDASSTSPAPPDHRRSGSIGSFGSTSQASMSFVGAVLGAFAGSGGDDDHDYDHDDEDDDSTVVHDNDDMDDGDGRGMTEMANFGPPPEPITPASVIIPRKHNRRERSGDGGGNMKKGYASAPDLGSPDECNFFSWDDARRGYDDDEDDDDEEEEERGSAAAATSSSSGGKDKPPSLPSDGMTAAERRTMTPMATSTNDIAVESKRSGGGSRRRFTYCDYRRPDEGLAEGASEGAGYQQRENEGKIGGGGEGGGEERHAVRGLKRMASAVARRRNTENDVESLINCLGNLMDDDEIAALVHED